jgi:GDP-L-fucose synthase
MQITGNKYTNTPIHKDSKIFVAGGTGLVGSAIIKNLLSKGYKNIIASYNRRKPITNNQSPITWEKLDLINDTEVSNFFQSKKPEFVILAAAKVGGIVANNTYRAEFIYENLQIQNNIIHQSYLHGVKKLLFLGSTCIYPKEAPQPMSEDSLLTSPLEYTNEPYAIAKIAGIKMCESYNIQHGTNFISVMPTNLYGPNDNFDLEKSHVLPALLRKIHLGKLLENSDIDAVKKDLSGIEIVVRESKVVISEKSSDDELLEVLEHYGIKTTHNSQLTTHDQQPTVAIEIWGSGNPRREFLYSEDMADACVYLMEKIDFQDIINPLLATNDSQCTTHNSRLTTHEIRNTHINIGTGIDISIKDLAYLIKDIVEFGGELYFNTDKPDGTMIKLTDPSKLHSLGWKHKVELEDGIKTMYEWYLNSEK